MAKERVVSQLACEQCKMRNYSQYVTKKRKIGSLRLSKYCPKCNTHNMHKETK